MVDPIRWIFVELAIENPKVALMKNNVHKYSKNIYEI